VAAALSKVLGRTITFHPITYEQQRQAMIDAGLPEAVADDNARAVALMAEGDCDYVTDDVPTLLDRPAHSFEQFATDYAAAFSSSPARANAMTRSTSARSSMALGGEGRARASSDS